MKNRTILMYIEYGGIDYGSCKGHDVYKDVIPGAFLASAVLRPLGCCFEYLYTAATGPIPLSTRFGRLGRS